MLWWYLSNHTASVAVAASGRLEESFFVLFQSCGQRRRKGGYDVVPGLLTCHKKTRTRKTLTKYFFHAWFFSIMSAKGQIRSTRTIVIQRPPCHLANPLEAHECLERRSEDKEEETEARAKEFLPCFDQSLIRHTYVKTVKNFYHFLIATVHSEFMGLARRK